jgi:curli production assembly/transport component CsgE
MIGLVLSALSSPVSGQTTTLKARQLAKDGVEGLVVNTTISIKGLAFYTNFLDFWREKPGYDKYSLEIGESLSRRQGNRVWVSFGQRRLVFTTLPTQSESIRILSEQAAETAYEAMITLSLPFAGGRDPDLSDDEI